MRKHRLIMWAPFSMCLRVRRNKVAGRKYEEKTIAAVS